MSQSLLHDAFAHHAWATLQLIDGCSALTPEQLGTTVPGTYGSIIETLRHIVRADTLFLAVATGRGGPERLDTTGMSPADLRNVIEANGEAWARILQASPDPDTVLTDVDRQGIVRRTATGVVLTQALHHGNDHRSQLCTGFAVLGVERPRVDGWEYGEEHGRVTEEEPHR